MWSAWSREFISEMLWSESRNFAAAAATLWNVKVRSVQAAAALSPFSAGVNQQSPPVCTIAAFLSLSSSHLQMKVSTCLFICQKLQSSRLCVAFVWRHSRKVCWFCCRVVACCVNLPAVAAAARWEETAYLCVYPLGSTWCFFTLRNLRFISGLHHLVKSFNFFFLLHILDLCAAYLQRRNTKTISQHVWQENNWEVCLSAL